MPSTPGRSPNDPSEDLALKNIGAWCNDEVIDQDDGDLLSSCDALAENQEHNLNEATGSRTSAGHKIDEDLICRTNQAIRTSAKGSKADRPTAFEDTQSISWSESSRTDACEPSNINVDTQRASQASWALRVYLSSNETYERMATGSGPELGRGMRTNKASMFLTTS